jgi:hypothetical protein
VIARLARIQMLIVVVTVLAVAAAIGVGIGRPIGIALAGAVVFVDFVVLRGLAAAVLIRRPRTPTLVGLALAKSLLLLVVPAAAVLLPPTVIDGASFAAGVSALPIAIVLDAFLGTPAVAAA